MIRLKDLLFGTVAAPTSPKGTVVRVHTMDGMPLMAPNYCRTPTMRSQIRDALKSLGWAHHAKVAEHTGMDNVVCRRVLSGMRKQKLVLARKIKLPQGGSGFEYHLPTDGRGAAA